jgi:hypothetical protein
LRLRGPNTYRPDTDMSYRVHVAAVDARLERDCSGTYLKCAVQRHGLPAGVSPARQLSLQPVVIGAVVEVTKRLKPSMRRVAMGGLTSQQAITRVNAEQVPKGSMRMPIRS